MFNDKKICGECGKKIDTMTWYTKYPNNDILFNGMCCVREGKDICQECGAELIRKAQNPDLYKRIEDLQAENSRLRKTLYSIVSLPENNYNNELRALVDKYLGEKK